MVSRTPLIKVSQEVPRRLALRPESVPRRPPRRVVIRRPFRPTHRVRLTTSGEPGTLRPATSEVVRFATTVVVAGRSSRVRQMMEVRSPIANTTSTGANRGSIAALNA